MKLVMMQTATAKEMIERLEAMKANTISQKNCKSALMVEESSKELRRRQSQASMMMKLWMRRKKWKMSL